MSRTILVGLLAVLTVVPCAWHDVLAGPPPETRDIRLACEWVLFEAWFESNIIPPVLEASAGFRERGNFDSYTQMSAHMQSVCETNLKVLDASMARILEKRKELRSDEIVSFCNSQVEMMGEANNLVRGMAAILSDAGTEASLFEKSGSKWVDLMSSFTEAQKRLAGEYDRLTEDAHRAARRVIAGLEP